MTFSTQAEMDAAAERAAQAPRLLVASDFDGTLAPLADEPMAARMRPETRAVIESLTRLPGVTVAFVSGRSLVDLEVIAEHTADSPILLAGSHGAEFWYAGEGEVEPAETSDEAARRDSLRAAAEARVAGLAGVFVEPKTFGFGVHMRLADAETAAIAHTRVDELVATHAPTWRRRTGHNIVEYSFRHEGKDSAVATLRAHVDATCVLFAGDDVTDEDALQSLEPGDLGVRIGDGETAATIRVPDITAFTALLRDITRLRAAGQPARD